MKITCVGGGPTGLYFALLSKLRSPRSEITVIERNAPGATHGWGVTWGDELLDDLYTCDPVSARRLRGASLLWGKQEVRIDGRPPVHLGGKYGYSMSRSRMQQILTDRASELGVRLEYGQAVNDDSALDADLVVAADGVGSRIRARHVEHFAPDDHDRPQPLHLARHVRGARGVHVRVRAHGRGLVVGVRLPVVGGHEHVRRRVRAVDVDGARARPDRPRTRACGCSSRCSRRC